MTAWLFASRERWFRVKLWSVVGAMALVLLLSVVRCGGNASVAVPPEPTGTSTALHAPTTAPVTVAAVETFGPPDPIALEAVRAFLAHDIPAFTRVATPEAAQLAAEAPRPAPNGVITGEVTVVHGGPTQQDLAIPTSFGVLLITMAVHGDAWLVDDMAYQK